MHLTLCTSLYALDSMHFTLCISLYALHSMHFTLCASFYALHSMLFTLCTSLYVLRSMLLGQRAPHGRTLRDAFGNKQFKTVCVCVSRCVWSACHVESGLLTRTQPVRCSAEASPGFAHAPVQGAHEKLQQSMSKFSLTLSLSLPLSPSGTSSVWLHAPPPLSTNAATCTGNDSQKAAVSNLPSLQVNGTRLAGGIWVKRGTS